MTETEFQEKVLDLLNQHTAALESLDTRQRALETAWAGRETGLRPLLEAIRGEMNERFNGLDFEITLLREEFHDEKIRRVALQKRVETLEETK